MNDQLGKIVVIDPEKDKRWDKFVGDHPLGWLTHLSGWKRVLEKSFKHMKGHYLVILNMDNIKAALPVYEVRSWLTGNKLVSIPFATLCDPLVSEISDMKVILEAVKRLAQNLGISCVEIRTHNSHTLIEDDSLSVDRKYKHHYLLLDRPPEELRKKFSRSCVRQRISRASKSDLVLKKVLNVSDLEVFYKLHLMSRKQNGLPAHPYKFIKMLWAEFSLSQKVTIFLAEHKRKTIAGIMLFKYKNRISAEYLVLDNKFLSLSPGHFLFWETIKSACEEGFKIFDFGRTSSANVSLMDFKKRWGTEVEDLPQFFYPKETVVDSIRVEQQWKYRMMKGICRHSPLCIQGVIGKFCYCHLG
ncbi:MAG: GNAT family N-acetyltransferase [Colwellia sp.]|nr:GNAT family N-acetyltransferase [Colwellia sp.]